MTRRALFNVLLLSGLAALGACASGNRTARSSTTLERAEIQAAGLSDMLSAVQQLRPRWLDVRAPLSINSQTRILVFMNRNFVGETETLRQFDTQSVLRLRYLDAAQADAQLSLPAGIAVAGVIQIVPVAGR